MKGSDKAASIFENPDFQVLGRRFREKLPDMNRLCFHDKQMNRVQNGKARCRHFRCKNFHCRFVCLTGMLHKGKGLRCILQRDVIWSHDAFEIAESYHCHRFCICSILPS